MPNNLVFNGTASELQVMVNGVDESSNTRKLLTDDTGKLQVVIPGTVTVTAENLDIRDLSGATDSVTVFGTVTVTAENLDIRDLSGATDSVTVFGTVTVTAENLDIRDLSGATDSVTVFGTVTVTAENLDIRDLSGATDSVTVFGTVTVTAEELNIQLGSRLFTESSIELEDVVDSAGILEFNTSEQSMYSFYIFNTGDNTISVNLQISPTTTDSYFMDDRAQVAISSGEKAVLVAEKFMQYTRLFYETSGAACSFSAYYNSHV
ncbi:DUF6385 domain-containing protein [Vallitalea maricola]|uniref:Uncharacterized protein n=1 Tax=Vallitalea maricola TaxID=3074433 RepID=A0ACB5UP45_9FIRM|nr:hypothetical protein AN2V17_35560 [Vallitalea sp. AN17-2]